jgi:hypothetical protein
MNWRGARQPELQGGIGVRDWVLGFDACNLGFGIAVLVLIDDDAAAAAAADSDDDDDADEDVDDYDDYGHTSRVTRHTTRHMSQVT